MTTVLRLGHRIERDKRISTHVCLTARAFGAGEVLFSNRDEGLFATVRSVAERFGGDFSVRHVEGWRQYVRDHPGPVVHLTMYGMPVSAVAEDIREAGDPLIIVGAEKVPRDVYDLADFNVAVGNQPHSEVAALAIMLDRLNPSWDMNDFTGEADVLPARRGKLSGRLKERQQVMEREECMDLLKKAGVSEKVMEHVTAVERRAMRWGALCGADLGLVQAGALLHDIGRAKEHTIRHGYEGYLLLKEYGVEERVARFALVHVGAGIPQDDAEKHGLPRMDMTPQTLEEKLVTHADNLTGGGGREPLARTLLKLHRKEEYDAVFRMLELHLEVEDALSAPPECV